MELEGNKFVKIRVNSRRKLENLISVFFIIKRRKHTKFKKEGSLTCVLQLFVMRTESLFSLFSLHFVLRFSISSAILKLLL